MTQPCNNSLSQCACVTLSPYVFCHFLYSTFVVDNFLYGVPVAMEMLAKYHMREELMTVGKVTCLLLRHHMMPCVVSLKVVYWMS